LSSEFQRKIERTFEALFGRQGQDWSFEHVPEGHIEVNLFPKGHLLATLDHLIQKYQSLSNDRKMLDFGETIGQELADTIEDYSNVRSKMEKVWCYVKSIRETKNLMEKMLKSTVDFREELDNESEIYDMIEILDDMVMSLIECQLMPKLKKEKVKLQSKFDYYNKLSEELRRITHIPEGLRKTHYQPLPKRKQD
jgi:predicted hydrocarbon binding protein